MQALLLCRKGKGSKTVEFFAGTEDAGGPLGVMDAVGEVLGFQTERTPEAVIHAALALAVGKHIAGVKLKTLLSLTSIPSGYKVWIIRSSGIEIPAWATQPEIAPNT